MVAQYPTLSGSTRMAKRKWFKVFFFLLETGNGLVQLDKMLQDQTVHLNLDNFREIKNHEVAVLAANKTS